MNKNIDITIDASTLSEKLKSIVEKIRDALNKRGYPVVGVQLSSWVSIIEHGPQYSEV